MNTASDWLQWWSHDIRDQSWSPWFVAWASLLGPVLLWVFELPLNYISCHPDISFHCYTNDMSLYLHQNLFRLGHCRVAYCMWESGCHRTFCSWNLTKPVVSLVLCQQVKLCLQDNHWFDQNNSFWQHVCKNEAYRVVLLTMHAADITICSSVSDWTEYRVSFSFLIMGFLGAFWWHLFESQALWVTGNPIFFSTDNSPAYVVLLLLRLEENRTPHWRERSDCKVITLKDTQGRQVINSCENATFGWGVLVVFKSIWARIDDAPRGFTGALGIPQCC